MQRGMISFILLLVIGALIFCSALFSGLETALFALKAHQLRRLEDQHPALKNFIQVFGIIRAASSRSCCWRMCW